MKRIKRKRNFLTTLRTVHGWMGVFVLPWVLIMGLTGFYLNHSKSILSIFAQNEFTESQFEEFQPPAPITRDSASILADSIWPKQPIKTIREEKYHGWPSFIMKKDGGMIILSIPTGHYYIKTLYTRRTFSPKGGLVHTKIYWGKIFKTFHVTGWFDRGLGTWLADIFSLILITFGVTGSMMWTIPRVRRLIRSRLSNNS